MDTDSVLRNHPTKNIIIVAFGLYEWSYTLSLLLQHWSKRDSAIYRLSAFAAVCHLGVIAFYLQLIHYGLNPEEKIVVNPQPFILVLAGISQATVLTVGLIRYRYLYSINRSSVPSVTVAVVIGISMTLLGTVGFAIALVASGASLAVMNIIIAVIILYCSILDVVLSIAFLNALIKGFGIDPVAARELIYSSDAKRLTIIVIFALVFASTQLTTGILQLTARSRESALSIAHATDWSNYLPAWSYIYTLNTFLHMSYNTSKTLLTQNSIAVVGFQQRSRSSGLTSAASQHAAGGSISKQETVPFEAPSNISDDNATLHGLSSQTDDIQLQELSSNLKYTDFGIQRLRVDRGENTSPYTNQIAGEYCISTQNGVPARKVEENWPLNGYNHANRVYASKQAA